jgi:cytochrome c-type biogenesis protein
VEALGSLGLAFAAGVVTVTSPCVLPILPAILGMTATQSRGRGLLIALGLATGFTVLGASISLFGSLLGLDSGTVRIAAGIMLIVFGVLMLAPTLQYRLLGRAQFSLPSRLGTSGWSAFATGLLLGVTWIPCAGPVLGTVSALVFSRADVAMGTAMFFLYGLGVAIPVLGIAYAGKELLLRQWMKHQQVALRLGGVLVALAGVLVLTGLDHETMILIQRFYTGWVL